ncbi:MAG: transcription-repair coupling factor, partial [Sphingobacteriaceae bacterium]|nr:transcription-repair coupling factor [Sphingobacteriaceae bacterium]
MNIRDLIDRYTTDSRILALVKALNLGKKNNIQVKNLVGSADAVVAIATNFVMHKAQLFILPNREEAAYFLSDLESILDKEILFFPSSFRKSFEFTQVDPGNVLARAEVLNALNHQSEYGKMVVTYPEALAEKVIDRTLLEKNTLEIAVGAKLGIDFINEFLIDYDFDRSDFVYEPGQFSIRGGIVDIFSFSNTLPYRIEFFGDIIETIRTFEIDSQLSVESVQNLTIVPNVQAKFLSENNINLLDYIEKDTQLWFKDVEYTIDIFKKGHQKAIDIWNGLSDKEKKQNP